MSARILSFSFNFSCSLLRDLSAKWCSVIEAKIAEADNKHRPMANRRCQWFTYVIASCTRGRRQIWIRCGPVCLGNRTVRKKDERYPRFPHIPFNRATSLSWLSTSFVNVAASSSNRFFSLPANEMYVDRILAPYINVISSRK